MGRGAAPVAAAGLLAAALLEALHAPPVWVFLAACAATVPLAALMGRATEQLAGHLGEGIGGLLNATFGNAAELIIALMALRAGLTEVVKASLTGSIIGNLLLVLGASILAGGLRHPVQRFNRTAAGLAATLLLLAAAALAVPATVHALAGPARGPETALSVEIAVVLLATYAASLVFALRTHRHLYTGAEAAHAPVWTRGRALLVLAAATAGVAWASELLVGSVEGAAHSLGMNDVFIGVVVVAVIGNAAEHSAAVWMALENRMDLSLQIALGSSLQIALFVAPVLVLAGLAMGRPLDLVFTPLEVLAVVVAAVAGHAIVADGESHWMEGLLLLALYLILAMAFYVLPA